jgi:signal transduction histidine kinase
MLLKSLDGTAPPDFPMKSFAKLQETFRQVRQRLGDAWEQQRQFIGNISHELRTPLTVVSGYLHLLRRSNNLNDYQREALETAGAEADRTIKLLRIY